MLECATDKLRVFTGTFKPDFYGSQAICDLARKFLLKSTDVSIDVLIESETGDSCAAHPLIMSLVSNQLQAQVRVARLDRQAAPNDGKHFALMDQIAYRIEEDQDRFLAKANFNAPHIVEPLAAAFDKIFASSAKLKLA
jgi:hypothetical protein